MKLGDVKHPFSLNCAQAPTARGSTPWVSIGGRESTERGLAHIGSSLNGLLPTSALAASRESEAETLTTC
jgi:hypothetical protein